MTTHQGDEPNEVDGTVVQPSFTPDYSDTGVPSFDYVRDRIENRAHTATGLTELAGVGGPDVQSLDQQQAEREEAGRAKLAEIRRAMGKD
ncbi:hypothetical protein [Saccharothrix obliqua]|uniref:hypothetical protein n=1 Tax=Saccharothrix obliqua TaxID=2861747 RepID=UPI001C5DB7F2|nr:hypothetical protein [Saccharothrix obliqua]MBW4718605.1 hypothetical protein [Saccharothrix obliqua]